MRDAYHSDACTLCMDVFYVGQHQVWMAQAGGDPGVVLLASRSRTQGAVPVRNACPDLIAVAL